MNYPWYTINHRKAKGKMHTSAFGSLVYLCRLVGEGKGKGKDPLFSVSSLPQRIWWHIPRMPWPAPPMESWWMYEVGLWLWLQQQAEVHFKVDWILFASLAFFASSGTGGSQYQDLQLGHPVNEEAAARLQLPTIDQPWPQYSQLHCIGEASGWANCQGSCERRKHIWASQMQIWFLASIEMFEESINYFMSLVAICWPFHIFIRFTHGRMVFECKSGSTKSMVIVSNECVLSRGSSLAVQSML